MAAKVTTRDTRHDMPPVVSTNTMDNLAKRTKPDPVPGPSRSLPGWINTQEREHEELHRESAISKANWKL